MARNEINMYNVAQKIQSALPDYYSFSSDFREYISDKENNSVYSIFGDYYRMLSILIDVRNEVDLARYFNFLNTMISLSDSYINNCIYECIIEPLALIDKKYYDESLKRLNREGVELLMFCKSNPPLGEVPPPW